MFATDPIGGARTASGQGVGGVRVTKVMDDPSPMKSTYDPSNPAADSNGYVQMPNVDPVQEMVNMISASRSYHQRRDAEHREDADAQDADDRLVSRADRPYRPDRRPPRMTSSSTTIGSNGTNVSNLPTDTMNTNKVSSTNGTSASDLQATFLKLLVTQLQNRIRPARSTARR